MKYKIIKADDSFKVGDQFLFEVYKKWLFFYPISSIMCLFGRNIEDIKAQLKQVSTPYYYDTDKKV